MLKERLLILVKFVCVCLLILIAVTTAIIGYMIMSTYNVSQADRYITICDSNASEVMDDDSSGEDT